MTNCFVGHVLAANTVLYDDAAQTITNKTIDCEANTFSGNCGDSSSGVQEGLVSELPAAPQSGARFDITDGTTRTDCTTGTGTTGHRVECCYDGTKWQHCIAGEDPLTPLLSDFAGRGLESTGGETSIHSKGEPYCANIPPNVSITNWIVNYIPEDMTVTKIYCLIDTGTSVDLTPNECDGDGTNCTAIEATITCGPTGTTINLTDIDNSDLDAGDTIRITRGAVNGTVYQAIMCFSIRYDD